MTDHSSGHEPNLEGRRAADARAAAHHDAGEAARGHAHEHAFVREPVAGAPSVAPGPVAAERTASASLHAPRRVGVPEPELDRIIITRMHARGHHGVFEHERRDGQDFYVDAEAWVDAATASSSDHIGDTLHYGEWMHALHAIVTGDPVDLIETLAERLAAATFGFDDAVAVRVTVHKPQAPVALDFQDVAVSILRHRPAAPGSTSSRRPPTRSRRQGRRGPRSPLLALPPFRRRALSLGARRTTSMLGRRQRPRTRRPTLRSCSTLEGHPTSRCLGWVLRATCSRRSRSGSRMSARPRTPPS